LPLINAGRENSSIELVGGGGGWSDWLQIEYSAWYHQSVEEANAAIAVLEGQFTPEE
jgi:hypothetical protein